VLYQKVRDLTPAKLSISLVSPEDAVEEARPVYPFTAIIGQEEMKFAALMNIIDPNIGGIMVMGDRGTGKSTTVRSLVRCFHSALAFVFTHRMLGRSIAFNRCCQG